MSLIFNVFTIILALLFLIMYPLCMIICILSPLIIVISIPIFIYYYKMGNIKMRDNEIDIKDVKFESRNILEEVI